MTIVAIWREDADFLWAVSDTRLSVGSATAAQVTTDAGSKLFSLPVVCRVPAAEPGFLRAAHYSTTLGFAYAGNTLAATLTYATSATLLQNLTTSGSKNPPHLRSIAELVCRMAERFSKEVLSASAGQAGYFEASIFGWEPHHDCFEIYHIRPSTTASSVAVEVVKFGNSGVLAMGSGVPEFDATLRGIRKDHHLPSEGNRAPKLAIEAMVSRSANPQIGGSVSVGICAKSAFQLFSRVEPVVPGQPLTRMTFNGIDIASEVGWIDQYFVGMMGMP